MRVGSLPFFHSHLYATFVASKNIPETCCCPFVVKRCFVPSWTAKLLPAPPLASWGMTGVGQLALPLPVDAQRDSPGGGWSPAVTLSIVNSVETPAQKHTGLGVRRFQINICLEFSGSLCVVWGSMSVPLEFYKDT